MRVYEDYKYKEHQIRTISRDFCTLFFTILSLSKTLQYYFKNCDSLCEVEEDVSVTHNILSPPTSPRSSKLL